jgi:hypothetical protein
MVREAIWKRKWRVAMVLGTDLLSVGAQVGAITIALSYARMMQRGQLFTISQLGISVDPRESMWLLAAATAGALIAWQVSSLTRFFSDKTALRLSIGFEETCFLRVLSSLTNRLHLSDELHGTPKQLSDIIRCSTAYVRQTGVASRVLLETIIPFVVFCISFSTLMITSVLLTGLVVLLCVLFMPMIWKINRQGVFSSKDFFALQPKAGTAKRNMIQNLTSSHTPRPLEPGHFEPVITETEIGKADDAFGRRMLVVQKSQMATQCLMGLGIATVMAVFGFQSLRHSQGWGSLVVYIIALRYCLTNLGRVSSALANLNRLYPSFSNVYYYLQTQDQHAEIVPERPSKLSIRSTYEDELPGEVRRRLPLSTGMRVDILSAAQANTIILPHLLKRLFGLNMPQLRGLMEDTWFATTNVHICRLQLRDFLHLGPEVSAEEVLAKWPESLKQRLHVTANDLPLDEPFSDEQWNSLPEEVRHALALTAAVNAKESLVIITSGMLEAFPEPAREAFLDQLSSKTVCVLHKGKAVAYNANLVHASDTVLLAGIDVLGVQLPQMVESLAEQWDNYLLQDAVKESLAGLDTSIADEMDDDLDVSLL